jgi:hypothetical protein
MRGEKPIESKAISSNLFIRWNEEVFVAALTHFSPQNRDPLLLENAHAYCPSRSSRAGT